MAIRRSDRETLQSLMDEYGMAVVLDEMLAIFDECVESDAEEEALGVLDRALRKAIKILGTQQPQGGRGRRQQLFENAVEEDLEDEEDLDEDEE
jgi:hypothetical protein